MSRYDEYRGRCSLNEDLDVGLALEGLGILSLRD